MYPEKKKFEYKTELSDYWDELIESQTEQYNNRNFYIDKDKSTVYSTDKDIRLNSKDILRYLYEYIDTYFNQFGHAPIGKKFDSWWHQHEYGTSYQPIVQCCFIRKGRQLDLSVREHHSQKRITELAKGVHGVKYDRQTKMKSYENIDVCWAKNDSGFNTNNLILALEYEDSGNLDDLFQELYLKLIYINSTFTVLCTRLNYNPDADFISIIEKKLKKDNITKPIIFIFFAPDSTINPTRICFSEYVNFNSKLKKVDNNEFFINITSKKTPDGIIIEKIEW